MQDTVLYEGFVGHAADLFDHLAQYDVSQIGVHVSGSGTIAQTGFGRIAYHIIETDRRLNS